MIELTTSQTQLRRLTYCLRSAADGSANDSTDIATSWRPSTREGLVQGRVEIEKAFDETVVRRRIRS